MSKRYVHWRNPNGGPHTRPDDKYEPAELLAEIGKTASIDVNGNPSWIGLSSMRWEQAVIGSTVVLDPDQNELNRRDSASIMTSAINTVIRRQKGKTPLNPSAVRAEANKRAAQFFRKPMVGYYLVSSLSVKSIPFKTATIDDCILSSLSHRKRYPLPQALRLEYSTLPEKTRTKWRKHQLVRVKTHGRSIHEAAGRAIEALTHLCGVWNLLVTRGSWSIGSPSRIQHPIGVVHAGPFHTLHDDGGAPVDDIYWFEPDALEPYELFIPKTGWDKIEKNRKWVARRLRSLPYARDLRRLILRYAKAVSHSNADVAFLQMWSILESLTDTVGGKYDETIKRALWSFEDRQLSKELLEYLRTYRNQYVHAARSDDNRDQVAMLIKDFIDPHLVALLRNDFQIQTIKDYARCLSLPTSQSELRKTISRTARACRLQEMWNASR